MEGLAYIHMALEYEKAKDQPSINDPNNSNYPNWWQSKIQRCRRGKKAS